MNGSIFLLEMKDMDTGKLMELSISELHLKFAYQELQKEEEKKKILFLLIILLNCIKDMKNGLIRIGNKYN